MCIRDRFRTAPICQMNIPETESDIIFFLYWNSRSMERQRHIWQDVYKRQSQNTPHHCYTVGEHILHSLCHVRADKVLRITMLRHDIGKPVVRKTDENGRDHFKMHGIAAVSYTHLVTGSVGGNRSDFICFSEGGYFPSGRWVYDNKKSRQ